MIVGDKERRGYGDRGGGGQQSMGGKKGGC